MRVKLSMALATIILLLGWSVAGAQTSVRVGIYENAPLSFVDENGVPQGIYVDILRDIAAVNGWNINFVACDWSACLDMLQTGKIDLLGPIAYSNERAEIYDFSSEILLVNWGQIYVASDSDIQSFLDLRNKKIAVLLNDIYYPSLQTLLDDFQAPVQYVEADNYREVLQMVSDGEVDAGLTNRFFGLMNEQDFEVKKSPIVLNPIEILFAAPKGRHHDLLTAIDNRMQVLKSDPNSIYYRSVDRWLGGGTSINCFPRWLLWSLGVASVLGVMLAILALVLRREVRLRTRELTDEMEQHKRTALSLQASERRYRTLVENSPVPIFVHRAGKYVYLNRLAIRMHGAKSVADFAHKTLTDFLLPEEHAKFDELQRMAVLKPNVVRMVETKFRRFDGTILDVMVTVMSVSFDGNPAQLVIAQDITERKQVERSLQKYAAELERSNRELQDFAYVASHDLQEPLRKIQIFGERLQAKYGDILDDTGRDYLARMDSAARRMKLLIDNLLTFSRVTTTGARPFSAINLSEVVEGVLQDLEARIAETGATIIVDELPTIEADPMQMRQLFQNLLGNALKFHREGVPPEISISSNCDPETNEVRPMCHITIADNGIGFEQEYANRIFGVFQRLHARAEFEGTGVGLALCRKIVERHQGSICAEGIPGAGARFIVTLPQTQPPPQSAP